MTSSNVLENRMWKTPGISTSGYTKTDLQYVCKAMHTYFTSLHMFPIGPRTRYSQTKGPEEHSDPETSYRQQFNHARPRWSRRLRICMTLVLYF